MSLQPLYYKEKEKVCFRSNGNIVGKLHVGKDLREHLVHLLAQGWTWPSGGWVVCGGLPAPDLSLAVIREGERAVLGLGSDLV